MTSTPNSTALSWLPRSWPAAGLFLLLTVAMLWPVFLTGMGVPILWAGCFLGCDGRPQHAAAVISGVITVVLLAVPFAGVRLYQGHQPTSGSMRWGLTLPVIGVVLVTNLWTGSPLLAWIW
jgi:hypothetical protein